MSTCPAGRVVFTAFPVRDVKPVTEGVYRWAPGGEPETIIPPDRYSVDYAGFYGDQVLCLGLVMKDFGVYEHPTFFLADGGEMRGTWAAMTGGSTPRW